MLSAQIFKDELVSRFQRSFFVKGLDAEGLGLSAGNWQVPGGLTADAVPGWRGTSREGSPKKKLPEAENPQKGP